MTRLVSVVPEDFEQELVMRWAAGNEHLWPELEFLFHPANGEKRAKRTAQKLKRMGVKAGVPDLVLPVARGGFHSLYLEMKRLDGGRLSIAQKRWRDALRAAGCEWAVAHGHEQAIAVIKDYLAADGCPTQFKDAA